MDLPPLARPIEYLLSGIASTSAIITRFIRSVRTAHADLSAVTRDLSDLRLVLELLHDENDVPLRLQGQILVLLESCGNVLIKIDNVLARCPEPAKWAEVGREEINKCRTTLALFRAALAFALEVVSLNSSQGDAADIEVVRNGLRADVDQLMEHARSAEHGTLDAGPVLAAYLKVVVGYVARPGEGEKRQDMFERLSPLAERNPVLELGVASLQISGGKPISGPASKDGQSVGSTTVQHVTRESWSPNDDQAVHYTAEPAPMTPKKEDHELLVPPESPTLPAMQGSSVPATERVLPPPIVEPIWKRSESLRSSGSRSPFSSTREPAPQAPNKPPDSSFPQIARVASEASRRSGGSSSGSNQRFSWDKFPSPRHSTPPPDYRRTWVDAPVSLPTSIVPVPVKSPHRTPIEIIPQRHLIDSKGKASEVLHIDVSPSTSYLVTKHGNKLVKIWFVPRHALHGTIKTTSYVQPSMRSREYFVRSHEILSESAMLMAVTTHFGLTLEIYNYAKGGNGGAKKVQVIEDVHRWAASRSDESYHQSHDRAGLAIYRPKADRIERFYLANPGAKNPFAQDPRRSIDLLRAELPFIPKFPELAYNGDASMLVAAAGPRPGDPVQTHTAILVAWRVNHGLPPTTTPSGANEEERHKPYRVCVPSHPALHSALPTCLATHGDVAVSVWIPPATPADASSSDTVSLTPSSTAATAGSIRSIGGGAKGGKYPFSFRRKHHHTIPPVASPSPLSNTPSTTTLPNLSHAPTNANVGTTTETTPTPGEKTPDRIVLVWHLPTNTTRLFAIPPNAQACISPDCRRLAYCSLAKGEFVVIDLAPLVPPFFPSTTQFPAAAPQSAVDPTAPSLLTATSFEPAPEEIWRWPNAARDAGFASFGQLEGMVAAAAQGEGTAAAPAAGGTGTGAGTGTGGPTVFEFSRDGRMLVIGDKNGGVGVYEIAGNAEERFELGVGDEVAWADVVDGGGGGGGGSGG